MANQTETLSLGKVYATLLEVRAKLDRLIVFIDTLDDRINELENVHEFFRVAS